MGAFRTAYVYVRNAYAGALSETDEGYSFEYDRDYLRSEGRKRRVADPAAVGGGLLLENAVFVLRRAY